MLFHSWRYPPQGLPKPLFGSGNCSVCSPNVFQIPMVKNPSAMAVLSVGTWQVMLLSLIDALPCHQPDARSTSPAVSPATARPVMDTASNPATTNPLTIRMTSSPPLDSSRHLHAPSESS